MPRPNLGPRLKLIRKTGWTRAVYYIVWTDDGRGREKSTGSSDPGPAEAAFQDWLETRRRTRRTGASDPSQVLIRDILLAYAEERGPAVASSDAIAYAIEPMLAFFGRDPISKLTTSRARDYWDWRRRYTVLTQRDPTTGEVIGRQVVERGRRGDGTIIRELAGTLRPAIAHAIRQKRLQAGEYHVPVPSAAPPRADFLTPLQAARLLREARRDKRARLHLPLYILLGLYTGQRRGALLDLQWTQVDLVAGQIDFNPPGRRLTRKRRSAIPVPGSLLSALRRAQARASSEFVIAYNGEAVGSVKKGLTSAARRAGVPWCTSHTLRHTCATWMVMNAVPMADVAAYLNTTVAMIERVYGKHHPDHLRRAVNALRRKT